VISARVYSPSDATDIEPAGIGRARARTDRLLWVDAVDPSETELAQLQAQFELHPLAIEDVRERHQRAKLEHYRTHSFLVAHSAGFVEVNLFVGPSWLITIREEAQSAAHWPVERARHRYERTRRGPTSVGHLVYVLLDELVDGYFDALDGIEDGLERIEDSIFAETLGDERPLQQELYGIRRTLLAHRHAVAPLRDVLAAILRKEAPWAGDDTLVHLQDVYDHVLRILELIDSHRELLSNAVDAHLAITSNRISDSMKRMTSWGAILLGSTLVTGIYGMNFRNVPELDWRFGFAWAIGLMLAITAVGYRYFRSRRWL
jgi:magnesium transporter